MPAGQVEADPSTPRNVVRPVTYDDFRFNGLSPNRQPKEKNQMSASIQEILKSFDELPDVDKRVFLREILLRSTTLDIESPSDDELISTAEELFLELDDREAKDADTASM